MRNEIKNVLILGIGNILRRDDGIGVHVVNSIIESGVKIPKNVEVVDGGTCTFDLVPIMTHRDRIVIVDALKTDDIPGSIYRFPAHYLKREGRSYLLQYFNIGDIILQVRMAGFEPEVEIIGIVPGDIESHEIGLSDPVRRTMQKAVAETIKAATAWK